MNYLENQIGDEYGFTSFNNRSKWYCSKLPWVGWEEFYSTSLNRNGGLCTVNAKLTRPKADGVA